MEMTEQEAIDFFSEFFRGKHHIPKRRGQKNLDQWGEGFCVCVRNSLSTFDFDELTRLVILAHKKLMRAEISPASSKYLRIIVFKRKHEGHFYERHPNTKDLIEMIKEVEKY